MTVTLSSLSKHVVPDGAKIIPRKGTTRAQVIGADGKVITFPERSAEEKAFIAERFARNKSLKDQKFEPTGTTGSIGSATLNDANLFKYMAAVYHIPTAPTLPSGSAQLAIWIGLETTGEDFVFQPVAVHTQGNWNLFSVYADTEDLLTSSAVAASAGDTPTGVISVTGTGASCAFQGHPTTLLSISSPSEVASFPFALVVEETDNVTNAELPASISFTSVSAENGLGHFPTGWSINKNNTFVSAVSASGNDSGTVTITNIT